MKGRLLLFALAAMSVWLIASTSSGATAPVPVGITEGEYYIHLSGRLSAPHGRVQFNIWNRGQDDHNFYVGRNQHQYALIARIPSGGHATVTVTLPAGTYNLACKIPGHVALGMLTHFRVT